MPHHVWRHSAAGPGFTPAELRPTDKTRHRATRRCGAPRRRRRFAAANAIRRIAPSFIETGHNRIADAAVAAATGRPSPPASLVRSLADRPLPYRPGLWSIRRRRSGQLVLFLWSISSTPGRAGPLVCSSELRVCCRCRAPTTTTTSERSSMLSLNAATSDNSSSRPSRTARTELDGGRCRRACVRARPPPSQVIESAARALSGNRSWTTAASAVASAAVACRADWPAKTLRVRGHVGQLILRNGYNNASTSNYRPFDRNSTALPSFDGLWQKWHFNFPEVVQWTEQIVGTSPSHAMT